MRSAPPPRSSVCCRTSLTTTFAIVCVQPARTRFGRSWALDMRLLRPWMAILVSASRAVIKHWPSPDGSTKRRARTASWSRCCAATAWTREQDRQRSRSRCSEGQPASGPGQGYIDDTEHHALILYYTILDPSMAAKLILSQLRTCRRGQTGPAVKVPPKVPPSIPGNNCRWCRSPRHSKRSPGSSFHRS